MRFLLGLALIVFSVGAAAQADSYRCEADLATGFRFNGSAETWDPTLFDVSDSKYIIARSNISGYTWAVTQVGEYAPTALCKDDMRGDDQFLICDALHPVFYFSAKTLRFTHSSSMDYILYPKIGQHRTHMEIGTCSPL